MENCLSKINCCGGGGGGGSIFLQFFLAKKKISSLHPDRYTAILTATDGKGGTGEGKDVSFFGVILYSIR